MSAEEFRFMLWVQGSDGAWKLRMHCRTRGPVEQEGHALPPDVPWRLVGLYEGVLEERCDAGV